MAHSLIYLGYKHVVHRFAVFATSNCVVVAMVVDLAPSLPRWGSGRPGQVACLSGGAGPA